ncbi:MAG: signal recognition particle receptor subunit alpha, partial [Bacteroidales bacterium]|nr:signal recognition particle receptor subunit alpha [Bacteroidales bacterium]
MALLGFFTREKKESLNKGLEKTKESVFFKLSRAVVGKSKVDDEVLDNLEEVLVSSDVGVETTIRIIKRIEERVARDKYLNTNELNTILKDEIVSLLRENDADTDTDFSSPLSSVPHVIMIVGVNGSGKTTTIAKLAYQ